MSSLVRPEVTTERNPAPPPISGIRTFFHPIGQEEALIILYKTSFSPFTTLLYLVPEFLRFLSVYLGTILRTSLCSKAFCFLDWFGRIYISSMFLFIPRVEFILKFFLTKCVLKILDNGFSVEVQVLLWP